MYKNNYIYIITFGFTAFTLFVLLSCSTIKFSDSPLRGSPDDWLMPGGTPQRNNVSFSRHIFKNELVEVWSYNVDAGFPKYPVTVSDFILFASTLEGKIHAFNIINGTKAGSISVKAGSISSAPIINKNELLFTTNGPEGNFLYSYSLLKGEENWKIPVNRSETAPVFLNGFIYFATVEGDLICFRNQHPDVIWNAKLVNSRENFKAYYSSPAVLGNKIFIGNDNGNLYSFDLATGEIYGRFETGSKINSDVSVTGNHVIFGNIKGEIFCLDTLLNLKWKNNSGFKVISSFTYKDDILFTPSVEGKLLMMNLENGKIIKELSTGGVITAPPLLHNNRVYVGSYDKYLYCFDAGTGELINRYLFEGKIRSSVVVWREFLIVTSDDRNIYCFK
jgi:outer membrane protein assembly factor BamB